LYGSLLQLLENKQQNFKWVGVLQSTEEYTDEEKSKISAILAEKGCYPIFMVMNELLPYYNFYENVMKTLFHNFKSLYETDLTHLTHLEFQELWRHYILVNQKFAQKINEMKTMFPTLK
jgi:trehalose-6-phosphate synthase